LYVKVSIQGQGHKRSKACTCDPASTETQSRYNTKVITAAQPANKRKMTNKQEEAGIIATRGYVS